MNNYKHIELAILNSAMTAPLNFVIFTTENNKVKPKNLSSVRTEAQIKSVQSQGIKYNTLELEVTKLAV